MTVSDEPGKHLPEVKLFQISDGEAPRTSASSYQAC